MDSHTNSDQPPKCPECGRGGAVINGEFVCMVDHTALAHMRDGLELQRQITLDRCRERNSALYEVAQFREAAKRLIEHADEMTDDAFLVRGTDLFKLSLLVKD